LRNVIAKISVFVRFLWAKWLNVKDICRVNQFTTLGKYFADKKEVETKARKWLRQQPKDFYAEGSESLVKRWVKCVNVGGGYVEK
jgi:hypothetical protein